MKMYRILVIIEKEDQGYEAYAPDLPGCVAVGVTQEEVEKNMREAITLHLPRLIPRLHQDCGRQLPIKI